MGRYITIGGVTFRKNVGEIVEEFRLLYPTSDKHVLSEKFHICETTIIKLAHALGLKKAEGYNEKMAIEHLQMAHSKLRETNGYQLQNLTAKGFTKGDNWWNHATDEQKKMVREKIGRKRREIYKAEIRRVSWGLPQRTKLAIMGIPEKKRRVQCSLRKAGYIEVDKNRFLVPENRRPRLEKSATERFSIKFLTNEEWNID